MISKTAPTLQCPNGWQAELAAAVRDPAALLSLLQLPDIWLDKARAAAELFPLRVPHAFISRMRPGDINDPLLLQVLPVAAELASHPGYVSDPVGDIAALAAPGLIHKYHGRALLVTTGACAVHCRYCFRRHFPYQAHQPGQNWPAIHAYLQEHPEIDEIILSGGDPLSLGDKRFGELVAALSSIPQLATLRLHTRLPVVLPSRITPELLQTLGDTRLQTVMVLHINHPNEIDAQLAAGIQKLGANNIHCLNQSVLLRGVNDDAGTLTALSKRLFQIGVLPYYLHQLDPVAGAHHFHVSVAQGLALMAQLRARLPGYLVPRYAQEIPGEQAKMTLAC